MAEGSATQLCVHGNEHNALRLHTVLTALRTDVGVTPLGGVVV